MTRRIILVRHAKSSWSAPAPDDHGRPLNKRGRRDAPRVAAQLRLLGWLPDRVISSDALRTRETWEGMAHTLGASIPVRFTPALYHAGIRKLRDELGREPASARCLMALGHNPGWEDALSWLTDEDEEMTTGNAALLEGPDGGSWDEALHEQGAWRLVAMIRPRDLEDTSLLPR